MATPPTGPARNGFAPAVIARNAAEGARKEPTMTTLDQHDLTNTIRSYFAKNTARPVSNDLIEELARDITDRYELTPRTRPADERIGELARLSGPLLSGGAIVDDVSAGGMFLRLLAEDGYEIRRIEGGTE